MHEPFRANGSIAPLEVLLRIESRLGGLETGQRITLQAVEKAFGIIRDTQDRVSRLEASGQDPTEERVSLLKWVSEVLPATREIIIVILLLAAGLGLSWAPPLGEVTQAMQAVRSSD